MTGPFGPSADLLSQLSIANVCAYLKTLNWKRDDKGTDDVAAIYYIPDQPGIDALVPLQRELVDFSERMADLIKLISVVNDRRPNDVLNELLYPDGDLFKFGLHKEGSFVGSIPLEDGVKLYSNSRKTLMAAAHSVVKKRYAYQSLGGKLTSDFISNCRLGQSEIGSYLITIINPIIKIVGKDNQTTLFDSDPSEESQLASLPFERKVSLNVMSGLNSLKFDELNPDSMDEELEVPDGLSANLCEAIVDMRPKSDNTVLKVSVRFTKSRPWLPPTIKTEVDFRSSDFDRIDDLGKRLRSKSERTPTVIKGWINKLYGYTESVFATYGTISIQREHSDPGPNVKVRLTPEDYLRACQFHANQSKIQIKGTLHRDHRMKSSTLENYSNLRLASE